MHKVLLYSLLLIVGLIGSQFLPPDGAAPKIVSLLTMLALSFIMIHVGYEFEIDKSRPAAYAKDSLIAFCAASLPWIFCALYFIFAMTPRAQWSSPDIWRGAFLKGLFAAPTSAGVLFAMLAAAGLGATWVFAKARVLAIFDDLSTILLLIPLKAMIVGMQWQLLVVVAIIFVLLWLAWRYLHAIRLPIAWPFVLMYSVAITSIGELIYFASKKIDPIVPIHLEVLLPAFALGCMLMRTRGADPHANDAHANVEQGPESPAEQTVSTMISACFMLLVGLSMPRISVSDESWTMMGMHVLLITLLSNLGKMLPAFYYRSEASMRERLALAVGMWPRGEVGAGVLVVSMTYGLTGPTLTVAVLSLALNLLLTGVFIVIVKKLIAEKST